MKRTHIYSIFGQIEAVVAEAFIAEGKARRIVANAIPSGERFNDQNQSAAFAIVIAGEHVQEFNARIAELRA